MSRDDWDRFATYAPQAAPIASSRPTGRQSPQSSTNPNATCPVCGQKVFFYQNDLGSRVYFDDLGPPWPKHPCTDNEPERMGRAASTAQSMAGGGLPSPTQEPVPGAASFEDTDWIAMHVLRRSVRDSILWVRARPMDDEGAKAVRFSMAADVDFPPTGGMFFMKDATVSFFSFDEFEPVERAVLLHEKRAKMNRHRRKAKQKRRKKRSRR